MPFVGMAGGDLMDDTNGRYESDTLSVAPRLATGTFEVSVKPLSPAVQKPDPATVFCPTRHEPAGYRRLEYNPGTRPP